MGRTAASSAMQRQRIVMSRLPRNFVSGPLGRLLAIVAGSVLLVLGIAFSLAILAVAALAGLAGGIYFWWKTRKLRKILTESAASGSVDAPTCNVFEGEAIVIDESGSTDIPPALDTPRHPERRPD